LRFLHFGETQTDGHTDKQTNRLTQTNRWAAHHIKSLLLSWTAT